MYTPLARSGLAEESQAGLLERDSAHKTYMEVQQETESQKGKPCAGISRPAGGVIAHFKAAVGARYPAMVEPLKSPPPPRKKMIPEKIMHQLCLFPMLKTPGLKNYNPISQVKSFLPLTSPPLPSLALQRTNRANSKGGKRLSHKENQSDYFPTGTQCEEGPR